MSTPANASQLPDEILKIGDPQEPQDERLRAALLNSRRRLVALKYKLGNAATRNKVIEASEKCLLCAIEEARRRAYYAAWDCIHQFDEEMLGAMNPAELGTYWCSLRAEAQAKLTKWRAKAAESLI